MGLFKSDLYRSLAVGFVLGAIAIVMVLGATDGSAGSHSVVPAAVAETAP